MRSRLALIAFVFFLFAHAASQPPAPGGEGETRSLADQAGRHPLPSLGVSTLDWAKRVELEFEFEKLRAPAYSILIIQPLYQDQDMLNTVFVQGSQVRYKMFGDYRDTSNPGVGYRRLLLDNSLLAGLNGFFDQEWTSDHHRMSLGGELKWGMLDVSANRYFGLTSNKTSHPGSTEKARGGYDIELRTQVPYLPWLRVGAKGYAWHERGPDGIRGWTASLDADIAKNLLLEAGANDDDSRSNPSAFVKLTLRLPRSDRPLLAGSPRVDSRPFNMRDMMPYALDKVRRQNRIVCDETTVVASAAGGGPPPGISNGGGCATHVECASKLCVAGTCTACAVNADCSSNLCVAGVCQ